MAAALLIARLALAVVFLVAGAAKLSDRPGSRAAMMRFGFPPSLATLLALALPVIELLAAVALLPAGLATWGAWGALILLGAFTVGIAGILIRGVETSCHCFGQLHSSPVGWSTLGRNAALALVAAFVVVGQRASGSPSYLTWFGGLGPMEWVALSTSVFALSLLIGGAWFGMHLVRQHGRILLRLDALEEELRARGIIAVHSVKAGMSNGLPVGAPAPAFVAPNVEGGSTSLRELLAPGLPLVLVFIRPGCIPCSSLLPEIARWQGTLGGILTVGLISQGLIDENRLKLSEAGIQRALVQRDVEISDAFAIHLTPSAVLISPEGTVSSGIAQGEVAVRDLVGSIVRIPSSVPHAHADGNGTRRRKRPLREHERNVSTPMVSVDAR